MIESLNTILERIQRASEDRGSPVTLVAVSKQKPVESMIALYNEGHRVFGENYVQELVEKKLQLDNKGLFDVDIHFIGRLQSNKVKTILPYVSTIHSVDSIKLLHEIEKRAKVLQKKIGCYFQLNIDEEESKGGFLTEDLSSLQLAVERCEWVKPLGLMCIPNPALNVRDAFKKTAALSRKVSSVLGSGLSMGMSDDFELAIAEGSSIVRIGSALFGIRKNSVPK
jgi:pyridoxal phosphate enzyme (YggS family)